MNRYTVIALVVTLLIPLWFLLQRDFIAGLAYAVFLCVSMPTYMRIQMPGSLPQFTVYRLILIILLWHWLRQRQSDQGVSAVPLLSLFTYWAIADLFSLLFTTGPLVVSLKRYLDFVLETALYYFLLVTSLRRTEDCLRVLRAICLGVTLVALIAFSEKYLSFTPVRYIEQAIADPSLAGQRFRPTRDVVGTYQHRILLGTGMAMGIPLALALLLIRQYQGRRSISAWLPVLLTVAACYFSNSRGPWLAAIISLSALLFCGSRHLRQKLSILAVLAIVLLLIRPGIMRAMIMDARVTVDLNTVKGGTFLYRLELWKVAWSRITSSPVQFLFGCGPGIGIKSSVDWNLSYRGGQGYDVWSWDNHLAYELYQSGVVGLSASLALYGMVIFSAYRYWWLAPAEEKDIWACLLASLLAYCFMLTNILMFCKPVNFLFWSIAAVTFGLGREASLPGTQTLNSDDTSAVVEPIRESIEANA